MTRTCSEIAGMMAHGRDLRRENPAGWFLTEKLDGVRAMWTGSDFISRGGIVYQAPDWFTRGLPDMLIDGEIYGGIGTLDETQGTARSRNGGDRWKELRFIAFDAPGIAGIYSVRLAAATLAVSGCMFAGAVPAQTCLGLDHARAEFQTVRARGGEGLCLHHPENPYTPGRHAGILKIKSSTTAP